MLLWWMNVPGIDTANPEAFLFPAAKNRCALTQMFTDLRVSIGIDAYMDQYKGFMTEYFKDPGHRLADKIKNWTSQPRNHLV